MRARAIACSAAARTAKTSCPSTTSRGMSYDGAALVDVVDRRGALHGGAHAVAVVLDDEEAGELPERGHVERLVEGAVVHGRLAHEADDHLVAAAVLDGEADAGRDRECARRRCRARRGSRVDLSNRCIEPPLPRDAAIHAAEQLGHDRARRHAAGERLPVVAVGGDDVVVLAQQRDEAGADASWPMYRWQKPPMRPIAYISAVRSSNRRCSSIECSSSRCSALRSAGAERVGVGLRGRPGGRFRRRFRRRFRGRLRAGFRGRLVAAPCWRTRTPCVLRAWWWS